MAHFAQILVAVDYSECSDEALRLAGELARAFKSRLLVLHVLPINVYDVFMDGDLMTRETERLRAHVHTVLEEQKPVPALEVDVVWGWPHMDIVPYAIERRADVIVLGTHGRTGVKHVLLGSVAERTLRLAPCPVLTVRAGAAAAMGTLPTDKGVERRVQRPAHAGEVGRMMSSRPVIVAPEDVLTVARERMTQAGVRHLPVVDRGRLVGIVSDRDLAAHTGHLDHTRVNAAMTADPVTVSSNVAIETAARLMIDRGVRALPVVDGEEVVGVISATDIIEDYVRAARR